MKCGLVVARSGHETLRPRRECQRASWEVIGMSSDPNEQRRDPGVTAYQAGEDVTVGAQETAEAATRALREAMQQGSQVSQQVFDAWARSAEASLRATFELQNATLATGRSIVQSMGALNQSMIEQVAEAVRQAQELTMRAFEANVRQAQNLEERTAASETQGS